MNKYSLFKILLVTSFCNYCLCNDLYSDKVLKYDSETFKKNVGGTLPHLINFYAPWCAYCKRLKPVWDELAEKYNKESNDQKIVIAKVDCTVETPTCAQEDVSGYPSLIFYNARQTKGIKYQGKRDLVGLEEFIANSLKESDNVESLPPDASKMTSDAGALKLTDEDFHQTLDFGMHFVKFYAPWCGHCQRMAGTWEALAHSLQHDKSIKISKIDCTVNKMACTEFEVKGFPTLLFIINGKKVEKYQGARNLESFKQFISEMKVAHQGRIDVEDGLSQQGQTNPNMVVELSTDNFENGIAKGLSFVKFYVPWCGHSKKLAPVWNDLAQKFVLNPEVKIAEVDCTQDEALCAKHKVVGYPTLLVYRNGKFVTEYHRERKLETLHSFVLEYLHHTEL